MNIKAISSTQDTNYISTNKKKNDVKEDSNPAFSGQKDATKAKEKDNDNDNGLKALTNYTKAAIQKGQNKKGPKPQAPETPAVLVTFMQSIGVSPTNSKDGDNTIITNKLNDMEAQATTPAEKQYVKGLKTQFEQLKASLK